MPPYFLKVFFCINADFYSNNTRLATNYHIPALDKFVALHRPLLWNSLDSNIKSVTSLNTFRHKLTNKSYAAWSVR